MRFRKIKEDDARNSEDTEARDGTTERTRQPKDTPFRQQRLLMEVPILTPWIVISLFMIIAVIFIPVGFYLLKQSNSIIEFRIQYDGEGTNETYSPCFITDFNQSVFCTITFQIDEPMESPIYVYYEVENFLQNHRSYIKSRSSAQLLGERTETDSNCDPLTKSASGKDLNPCGLIANSFFTDIFKVQDFPISFNTSSGEEFMRETGITWDVDREARFVQPKGFQKASCASGSCDLCLNVTASLENPCQMTSYNGDLWAYWYPDNDKIDYLYETYPLIVSPLEGVQNEHFMIWMRAARLPTFRKLYGIIESDLDEGDTITFLVQASYYVSGFKGSKALILSTTSEVGGSNPLIGPAYIAMGSLALLIGAIFFVRRNSARYMKLRHPQNSQPASIYKVDPSWSAFS